jgi:hypothetical protein
MRGPVLLIDAEATAYVPGDWVARAEENGVVLLTPVKEVK